MFYECYNTAYFSASLYSIVIYCNLGSQMESVFYECNYTV